MLSRDVILQQKKNKSLSTYLNLIGETKILFL